MPRLLALVAALLFANCAAAQESPSPASAELSQLVDDVRAFDLAENPIERAREEDDAEAKRRLPSSTPEDEARRAAANQAFLTRAEAIADDGLSDQERVTRGLMAYRLQRRETSAAFDEDRIPFVNDSGVHTFLDGLARSTTIRSVDDADALAARYRDYPRWVDEQIAHMRRGIESGWVQPKLVVERVIETLRAQQIAGDPREHPLYEPFAELPDRFSEADRRRLQDFAQKAIVADVASAHATLLAFFEDEYLPAARETIGISAVDGGRDWYRALVKHHTSDPAAEPDAIHALGETEVARVRAEMRQIIDEVGFDGTFAEFLEFLRTDDQFYAPTAEQLLKESAWISKRIDDKMPEYFATLPRLSYGVRPVPDAIAPAYTTGRYWGGDYEEGRAGAFMVNTHALRERPLYELPALAAHEGVPGHHHQIALAQEIEGLPEFRNDMYVTAFGEGWGLYSETLAGEMGIYETPYERFGKLSYEMWRACRLVVDTGIHWLGWTRAQAEACFLDNSALSRGNITTEVDRYIAWPGQALAYKVGELKIKELRARAEAALGDGFDLRRFHDAVLLDGTLTLGMLEAKIDRWIAAELETANAE